MSATAQITGRLGFEPELRHTNGGVPVVNLSVANNRSVKVGDIRETIADWYRITVFGRDAEVIAQHAKKGSALAFNGRLQIERYVDREGHERNATILVANSFEFVPMAKREANTTGETKKNEKSASLSEEDEENDIPF